MTTTVLSLIQILDELNPEICAIPFKVRKGPLRILIAIKKYTESGGFKGGFGLRADQHLQRRVKRAYTLTVSYHYCLNLCARNSVVSATILLFTSANGSGK